MSSDICRCYRRIIIEDNVLFATHKHDANFNVANGVEFLARKNITCCPSVLIAICSPFDWQYLSLYVSKATSKRNIWFFGLIEAFLICTSFQSLLPGLTGYCNMTRLSANALDRNTSTWNKDRGVLFRFWTSNITSSNSTLLCNWLSILPQAVDDLPYPLLGCSSYSPSCIISTNLTEWNLYVQNY